MAHKIGATLALVVVLWAGFVAWMDHDAGSIHADKEWSILTGALVVYIFFRVVGFALGLIWKPARSGGRDFTYRRID